MNPSKVLVVASSESELLGLLSLVGQQASVDCIWLGNPKPPSINEVSLMYVGDNLVQSEDLVTIIQEIVLQHGHSLIAFPVTRKGKETAPRLASALNAGYVEGVTKLERIVDGNILFHRLTFGGVAEETTTVRSPMKVFTGVIGSKAARNIGTHDHLPSVVEIPPRKASFPRKKVSQMIAEMRHDEADIGKAERIVAFGRGVRNKNDIGPIAELAAVLDAKLACSRPLVEDLQWFPKEMQVGLSGTSVRPNLYVCIGISGQIQHVVGMRDSKVVVVINSDKAAPIFKYSDYAIIGDWYKIVPPLVEEIKRRQKQKT